MDFDAPANEDVLVTLTACCDLDLHNLIRLTYQ